MTSFAQRVSGVVLKSCQQYEPATRISSVLRDSSGRTVIRLSAGNGKGAARLLRALNALWPLAETSVMENAIDGSLQAEIKVPREEDEFRQAQRRASASAFSKASLAVALLFLALGCALYAAELSGNSRATHAEL